MKKRSKEIKRLRDQWDSDVHPENQTKEVTSRAKKTRKFRVNTCPLSRNLEMQGLYLLEDGVSHLFDEDPIHHGVSLVQAATLIYELRDEIRLLKGDKAA